MSRVLAVMGTRPECIKLAPVVRALRAGGMDVEVCATGQHRGLLDQALRELQLVARHELRVMRPDQTLAGLTARLLDALERLLGRRRFDLVLVQGDTTSTFAGALAAYYHGIPLAHVEAGLRTGRRDDPFPEEVNRALVARVADLHFAPTAAARDNLRREGIAPRSIHVTGNTGIDSLLWALRRPLPPAARRLLPRDGRRLVVVTAHRRESFGPRLEAILSAVAGLARREDLEVLLPVHPNPSVRRAAARVLRGSGVRQTAPLGYVSFVHLLRRAALIVTDSGGIQEEAPTLGVPVLVVREASERMEGVRSGHAEVVGTSRVEVLRRASALLDRPPRPHRRRHVYGDGRAAGRIARVVRRFLADRR